MSALNLPSIARDDFSAEADLAERSIRVNLVGDADIRVHAALDAFLASLHAEAQRVSAETVVIDFDRLEFMNSSCFRCFVTWIDAAQALSTSQQYRIHFRSNPERLWQRRSLHALRCFAVDLITITS